MNSIAREVPPRRARHEPRLAEVQLQLLRRFTRAAPFQPATNFWRAIELPVLAAALPARGFGLDVGCGDGVLTAILRELVDADWRLVGIDADASETKLAAASGQYAQLHTTGASAIPEADGTFDFAFANSVLEHVVNAPACLHEIARVLKPRGRFAATVPSPHFHDCLRGPLPKHRQPRSAYLDEIDRRLAHVQYWPAQKWSDELERAGLVVEWISCYLSRRQVQRWERLSNATGGLLYRWRGGRQAPIQIQRRLGLRRPLPLVLEFLAGPVARLIGAGLWGDYESEAEDNGCYLIEAFKPE